VPSDSPTTGLVAWWDEPASGPENMAADEVLAAEAVRLGRPLVRLYGWATTTFSLGAFQRFADAAAAEAVATLPLVRRPSGGGGIVHGSDLTYAVAVPREHPWGGEPQVLYDAFHEALVAELGHRGVAARLHPGRPPEADDEARLFCFDRRARGDLVVPGPAPDGHKILGSAQRRLKAAVLQHGSLLLAAPRGVAQAAAHPGLTDLFPAAAADGRDLATAWLALVAGAAGLRLEFAPAHFRSLHPAAIAATAERFADPAWLRRR